MKLPINQIIKQSINCDINFTWNNPLKIPIPASHWGKFIAFNANNAEYSNTILVTLINVLLLILLFIDGTANASMKKKELQKIIKMHEGLNLL